VYESGTAKAMSKGKYDPVAFSEGMGIFKEHLRQTCPQALEILLTPTVGFHYTAGGFIYSFPSEHRESFERLSKPPVAILADRMDSPPFHAQALPDDLLISAP
jgi:hypothetical protein